MKSYKDATWDAGAKLQLHRKAKGVISYNTGIQTNPSGYNNNVYLIKRRY